MADEKLPEETQGEAVTDETPPRGFNPYDLKIPDFYVNNVDTIIGGSEISIVFGHNVDPSGYASKPIIRVTMTHANFLFMMEYLNKRVKMFSTLYRERLITLDDIANAERELTKKAFDDMYEVEDGGDDTE
jgi:hypothetical protein